LGATSFTLFLGSGGLVRVGTLRHGCAMAPHLGVTSSTLHLVRVGALSHERAMTPDLGATSFTLFWVQGA
jgi:hypothetical protein